MSIEHKKRKRGFVSRSKDARALKRDALNRHLADLEQRTASFDVAGGQHEEHQAEGASSARPAKRQRKDDRDGVGGARFVSHFRQLPLSNPTAQGLRSASYTTCTPIQARAIPLALKGRDVLAAAPTGSGKTLAFLVPVLDILFRRRWGPNDGLGALIISPTRELAIQIFTVLRKIGSAHTLSAGLVIGGKDLHAEQARLARINILVATPGRLLQHMDQTISFDTAQLQVLVLDEADRILDMGFAPTLNAIVENLPKQRQTLLFSATQTRRVKDLARLSLVEPEYVAVSNAPADPADPTSTPNAAQTVGEDGTSAANSLPANLSQHYMVVPLPQKLSTLFSFIRTHTQSKAIVFLSSCRQVQFVHSTFCKLRPGVSLLCLHGKQKQAKRLQIFDEFRRTKHAVLFATDIAARGLDFPAVDWVIQLDAPEDAATYVHRVGRTARYQAKGNALLFACPSEENGLLAMLSAKGIEPAKIKPKESKLHSIDNQLQSFCFQETELKYLAQKAFVSYVRSIHLQRDKATFDLLAYPLEEYAASLGLPGAPKVKFVKEVKKAREKAARAAAAAAAGKAVSSSKAGVESEDEAAATNQDDTGKVRTKYDRMFGRKNQGVLSEHYAKLVADEDEDSGTGSEDEEDSDEEDRGAEAAEDGFGHEADLLEGTSASRPSSSKASLGALDQDDNDDDFLTLKRADHALSDDEADNPNLAPQSNSTTKAALARAHLPLAEAHLSKRKLQQGQSKKAMAAAGLRGMGDKIVFDEDGTPRAAYGITSEAAFLRDVGGVADGSPTATGTGAAAASDERAGLARAIKRFEEEERAKLRERDVEDKERAREKRREKRRREKERARAAAGQDAADSDADDGGGAAAGGGGGVVVVYEAPEDTREDGYETPDFDIGEDEGDEDGQDGIGVGRSEDDDDDDDDDAVEEQRTITHRPSKTKAKHARSGKDSKNFDSNNDKKKKKTMAPSTLSDEELALRLLSGAA